MSPLLSVVAPSLILEISREDDTNWPKKNIVGKQELEIRVGNDHIAFEVISFSIYMMCTSPISLQDGEDRLFG
jgi:protein mago nashi